MLADGIIEAAKIVDLKTPLVVRMEGTNSVLGRVKLDKFAKENSKLKI